MTTTTTNFLTLANEVVAILATTGAGVWTVKGSEKRAQITRQSDGIILELDDAYVSKPVIEVTINWDRDVVVTDIPYREITVGTRLQSFLRQGEGKNIKPLRVSHKGGAKAVASAIVMDLLPVLTPVHTKVMDRYNRNKAFTEVLKGRTCAHGYTTMPETFTDNFGPTTYMMVKGHIDFYDNVTLHVEGLNDDQAKRVLALLAEMGQERTREPEVGEE